MGNLDNPDIAGTKTSSDNFQRPQVDIGEILNDEPRIETILGIGVFMNTVLITEKTFIFTIKIKGEVYCMIGTYNIFDDLIHDTKGVNKIAISSCTPTFKGSLDEKKNIVNTILSSTRFNNYLFSEAA